MSAISDHEFEDDLPEDILRDARDAAEHCLPERSRAVYEQVYTNFRSWKAIKRIRATNETVLLAYFGAMAKLRAPSTLWARWSMLKTMLRERERIDINRYSKLKRFLKDKSTGFISKKAKTFTDDNIKKYLTEAPDHEELDGKVALIMGITGACRREELKNILLKDIRIEENHLVVTLPKTKTKITRTFTVNSPLKEIVESYIRTRSTQITHEELFLRFRNGKCINQVIGLNKIGQMPMRIAIWLGLEDPEQYTGHSFRRTSATLLANAGASMTTMKRHGGWRSATTAEGYIADSIQNKRKICNLIMDNIIDEDKSEMPEGIKTFKRIKFSRYANNQPSPSAQTSPRANTAPARNTCVADQPSTSGRPSPSVQSSRSGPKIRIDIDSSDCAIM